MGTCAYSSRTVGFLSRLEEPAGHAAKPQDPDALFRFDSGRCLLQAEAVKSVLVLGGTGSGKTTSVVLPIIGELLRRGHAGVILDIKGNLREQTRVLAQRCGREDDIVEFGSDITANKVNLLAGLRLHEIRELFKAIAVQGLERDPNIFWHEKGATHATDVAHVLYSLSRIAPRSHFSRQFIPTLKTVYAVLTNRALAKGLWQFYSFEKARLQQNAGNRKMQHILDTEETFSNAIQSDNFHVLIPKTTSSRSYEEQITWNLQRLLSQLSALKMTHAVMDRFSSRNEDAMPLDFDDLVYRQKKIVLIHFSPDCGTAGSILSRCLKERFYQAVLRRGRMLAKGQYTFLVGDEFQEIVDVNPGIRLNDMGFFSVSREFRNINIIATQSIASLYARGSKNAITSLLGNCTTKIFLQNSDAATQTWGRDMQCAGDIKSLGRGECLIEGIDMQGNVVSRRDSVNNAHASVAGILARQTAGQPRIASNSTDPDGISYGPSGLPACIERCLQNLPRPADAPGKKEAQQAGKGNEPYAEMCRRLTRMRDLSCQGKPYWQTDFDAEDAPTDDEAEPSRRMSL